MSDDAESRPIQPGDIVEFERTESDVRVAICGPVVAILDGFAAGIIVSLGDGLRIQIDPSQWRRVTPGERETVERDWAWDVGSVHEWLPQAWST
jgi:hypothetical protein